MKTFLIIAVVVPLLVLFGWITFSRSDDNTSVNINSDKAKQDTKKAAEAAKSLTRQAVKEGKSAINDLKDDDAKMFDDKTGKIEASDPNKKTETKQKQSDGVPVGRR